MEIMNQAVLKLYDTYLQYTSKRSGGVGRETKMKRRKQYEAEMPMLRF
jgi:hypothetical protein